MRTEFDPKVLEELVHKTLVWRAAQTPDPGVGATFTELLKNVEERYPNTIQWPSRWFWDRSAGFLQAVAVCYVSLSEYMLITGTPVATNGGSGPFPGEIYDWVIDGEIFSFTPGEFASEPTRPGELDYLPRGAMKGAAITDHYWAFEYGRGATIGMWPTTIFGTFMDMDFKNFFDMAITATKDVERNLLHPGPPRSSATREWSNWAGNQTARPAQYFTPSSLGDLVDIVDNARRANESRPAGDAERINIRAVGGGFSWSDLVPTNQWIVDVSRLDGVLSVDKKNHTVTVEAGMRVGQLTALTSRNGMVLHSPTVITLVTVGGMIGSGAHGGGMKAGSFPDWVTEFTFVRADGEVVSLRTDDPGHADDIRAAQVALGSLGLLYSVTIQCAPAYNVSSIDYHVPLDQAIAEIPERVGRCDFVEYFWFPTTATMWIKETSASSAQPDVSWLKRRLWALEDLCREKLFGPPALGFVAGHAPRLTPLMMKFALLITPPRRAIESANYALHYENYYPKCFDLEIAIPLEHAQDAWRLIVDEITDEAANGRYPVNLIAHSRFLSGSDSYLSATRNRDSCYIEILCHGATRDYQPFFQRMEQLIRSRFDGLPHWGKLYWATSNLKEAYGPDMDAFLQVRERWDPDRLFLNEFLAEQIFQLPPLSS